jgi:hypothetical protein
VLYILVSTRTLATPEVSERSPECHAPTAVARALHTKLMFPTSRLDHSSRNSHSNECATGRVQQYASIMDATLLAIPDSVYDQISFPNWPGPALNSPKNPASSHNKVYVFICFVYVLLMYIF